MKCEFIKRNHERCGNHAIQGKKFCFWHSPDVSEEMKKTARRQGGKSNKHTPKNDKFIPIKKIESLSDVANLLSDLIYILNCEIPNADSISTKIKLTNSIGYLTNYLISALEKSEMEQKMEALEQLLQEDLYLRRSVPLS